MGRHFRCIAALWIMAAGLAGCGSASEGGDRISADPPSDDAVADGERGTPTRSSAQPQGAGSGGVGGFGGVGGAGGAGGFGAQNAGAGTGGAFMGGPDSAEPSPPTDPSEGDAYEHVGTNPFVAVDYDPFSTFAADVDTASYDLLRRNLMSNSLPAPASVRLEEYVNYFEYDYPAPAQDAQEPFSISLAAAPHVLDQGTTLLRVGIQGKEPPPTEKKPANLVFLVDVSGSMASSNKLPLVKELLRETLNVLDDTDTVSIVTYASGTQVELPPTPVSESASIRSVIDSLTAGGSTNGAGGIQLAYQQANDAFLEDGLNHVLLCTDGDFNVGTTSTSQLVELIEKERKSGVTLTSLGFGSGNLNDAMMERVSNAGNGIYAIITNRDHAIRYANDQMLRTLVHIAKDMKIQVELNSEHVEAYRLLGYENRAIADEDFRDDTVDAGEVGAGHRVTALYELVMKGDEVPQPEGALELQVGERVPGETEIAAEDMVLVKVRYKQPNASEEDPASEVSATLQPSDVLAEVGADADLQWAAAVAAFAEILKDSPYADPGHLPAIEEIVQSQASRDGDRNEFAGLLQQAEPLLQ